MIIIVIIINIQLISGGRGRRLISTKEKLLIAVFSPPFLLICSLLFSSPFPSTFSIIITIIIVITIIGGNVALVVSSPPLLLFTGIRNLSQAKIVFPSWYLLCDPQDIGNQFFWNIYPPFAGMVQYFFYLYSSAHKFNAVKSNNRGLLFVSYTYSVCCNYARGGKKRNVK